MTEAGAGRMTRWAGGRKFLVVGPLLVAVLVALGAASVSTGRDQAGSALTFSFEGGEAMADFELAVLRRRTITPEFDPPLGIRAGRVVFARGPIACDPGEAFVVEVTIVQGEARGQGRAAGRCTGEEQQWTAAVRAAGGASFTPGPAEACGVATTRRGGVTDSFSWCANPVLENIGR